MKDRVYMVLAFLGFILLTVVVTNNYTPKEEQKQFAVDSYYIPREVKQKTDSSVDLYQELIGSRKITCPKTDMTKTSEYTYNLATLYGNNFENTYGAKTMFVTLGCTKYQEGTNLFVDEIETMLSLKSTIIYQGKEPFRLGDLWDISEDEYVELIAPFTFKFDNVNTTSDNTIIITNTKNNCRITFSNVVNWFCAGPIGTEQTLSSGGETNTNSWEDHEHKSVIGSTANAIVSGGSIKDVIGYGDANTIVTIEKFTNSGWTPMSLKQFLGDSISR